MGTHIKKYTPERVEEILKYIRFGLTQEMASHLAGVDPVTVTRWKGKFIKFASQLYEAELEAKAFHVKNILDAARGTGQYAEKGADPHWSEKYLIMRFPHEFSPRRIITVEGKVDLNVEVKKQVEKLTSDQQEEMLKLLNSKPDGSDGKE